MLIRLQNAIAFADKFGRQMRFIIGPRQCGKTTLAKDFLAQNQPPGLYYNWDRREVKNLYRENPYFFIGDAKQNQNQKQWICFDEIHKMPKWKNILKDFFDTYEDRFQFVVTGSARLDLFRKSGDSLAGRYFSFKMFPLSLYELTHQSNPQIAAPPESAVEFIETQIAHQNNHQETLEQLLLCSGFPEPFLNGNVEFHQRWQQDYLDRLVREDLRDLTRIHELENVATLVSLLTHRVGNPLSVNALKEDLNVSYNAVQSYLKALRLTYIVFTLAPYSKKIHRAVKKETKLYFYDWTQVKEESARFENYVAVELCALVNLWQDAGFGLFDLQYVRTKDKKESDFLILKDKKPWLLFEVKLNEKNIAKHHLDQALQLGDIPVVQLVLQEQTCVVFSRRHYVVSASRFFGGG